MIQNGFFVNSKQRLFVIANGSMYPLETDEQAIVEPGYYDEEGEPVDDDELSAEDAAQFEESKHPRDQGGKFATSPGGGGGSAPSSAKGQKKKHLVGELLAKGTTSAELKKATGWKALSIPAMAKSLGLELQKYTENGVKKYKTVPKDTGKSFAGMSPQEFEAWEKKGAQEPAKPAKQKLEQWEKEDIKGNIIGVMGSQLDEIQTDTDLEKAKKYNEALAQVFKPYGANLSDEEQLELVSQAQQKVKKEKAKVKELKTWANKKTPLTDLTNKQHVDAIKSIKYAFGSELGNINGADDVEQALENNNAFANAVWDYNLSEEDALTLVKEAQQQEVPAPAAITKPEPIKCMAITATRASTFLTRWSSSAISRSWRVSA
jgi:hypothetical protein